MRLERFVREDIIEAGFAALRRALTRRARRPRIVDRALGRRANRAAIDGVEIVLTRYGGPEVLEPAGRVIRAPGSGEARIRQTAVGVNFIDVYCRRGSFRSGSRPAASPAWRRRASSKASGPGVANVRAGDRVAYACAPPGAYASMRDDARRPPGPPAGIHQRRERRGAAAERHDRRVSAA